MLEILNGPRDGEVVILNQNAEWGRNGAGPLSFPWDSELGEPQARVIADDNGWWLEPNQSPHGTHRMSKGERVLTKTKLSAGDIYRAHQTWFVVRQAD